MAMFLSGLSDGGFRSESGYRWVVNHMMVKVTIMEAQCLIRSKHEIVMLLTGRV